MKIYVRESTGILGVYATPGDAKAAGEGRVTEWELQGTPPPPTRAESVAKFRALLRSVRVQYGDPPR